MDTSVTIGNEHTSTRDSCERKRHSRRIRTAVVMKTINQYTCADAGNHLAVGTDAIYGAARPILRPSAPAKSKL